MEPEEIPIEDNRMLCQLLFEMTQFKTNIIDSLHAKIQNKEDLIIFLKAVKVQLLRTNQDQQKQIQHLKNEIAAFEKNESVNLNQDNKYYNVDPQETTSLNVLPTSTNNASTVETQFGNHKTRDDLNLPRSNSLPRQVHSSPSESTLLIEIQHHSTMEELLASLTLEETFTLSEVFRGVSDIQTEMIEALEEKQNMQNETVELLKNSVQIVADINSQNDAIIEMLKTQLSNCMEMEKLEKMLESTELAPEFDEKDPGLVNHTDETNSTEKFEKQMKIAE